jgi:hypothetical protein
VPDLGPERRELAPPPPGDPDRQIVFVRHAVATVEGRAELHRLEQPVEALALAAEDEEDLSGAAAGAPEEPVVVRRDRRRQSELFAEIP